MLDINTVAASFGAGKTTLIAKDSITLAASGETTLILQPTLDLNDQTARCLRQIDPSVHVEIINSKTRPNRAVGSLFEHMKRPFDGPHIVLSTFASFENLPALVNAGHFHVQCDEIPKGFISVSKQVPRNHTNLTNAIEIVPRGSTFGEVVIRDNGAIRTIAENRKNDEIDGVLRPVAQLFLNRNYRTFVKREQYEDLLKGRGDDSYLRIFSLLKPETFEGFRSVGMLGARAQDTLLYKWFKRNGVRFIDDEDALSKLRYREHLNGEKIDFYYGSETNWSLYAQSQDGSIRGKFLDRAINLLEGQPFCWLDNKVFETESPFGQLPGNEKLPHFSHGRNDFQHHDRIVITTAFNLPNHDAEFLEDFAGICKTEQKIAHDYLNTYQSLGRISIRDPNNNNRKMVILPDRQNAEWQSQLFPGSRVHSLGVDDRKPKKPGRTKQYESATERQRARRQRLKQEQEGLVERYELGHERIIEAGYHMSCHDIAYNTIRENVTAYQGSIIISKSEGMSFPITMINENFGKYMKGLHKRSLANKDDNNLIMPALCVPVSNTNSLRAENNALWGRHVYLDLDDTELKHLSLTRIFPHIEMICYNSYSHTSDKPRYRAVFLTDDVMSPATYKFLWHQIVQRIENAGYYGLNDRRPKGERKLHGIDNKPNVVSAFYLPCQPREGSGFYFHYKKNRNPIAVADWINNPIITRFDQDFGAEIITVSGIASQTNEHRRIIDAGMSRYRAAINAINPKTGRPTGSNEAMFNFALTLMSAGVERFDADVALTQAANESKSKKDRFSDKGRYMSRYWK
ncbi:hypothetical protein JHFBIEKO_4328 [Methylobacterium mesophilicum]|uniref:hypothetical protein n=1 Tax=Methylobacterium mesophilicum TaxID=39956 RepID=UPI001EE1FD6D|nr:hypothetical protein [Methylobacterium mesophilicum]GJE23864.1 hypothetical protein JHFBIEKO_4328 [Methylobacterium mesophilicum]